MAACEGAGRASCAGTLAIHSLSSLQSLGVWTGQPSPYRQNSGHFLLRWPKDVSLSFLLVLLVGSGNIKRNQILLRVLCMLAEPPVPEHFPSLWTLQDFEVSLKYLLPLPNRFPADIIYYIKISEKSSLKLSYGSHSNCLPYVSHWFGLVFMHV